MILFSRFIVFSFILPCLFITMQTQAQDLTFFFSAGDLSGEPDRFGNTHTITPEDAIDPRPFGNEALNDVFFDEDNLWLIYQVDGNIFLVSHAPGFYEDSPEITMEITPALPGKYEVILNFLDSNDSPGTGPIQAALGDDELKLYYQDDGVSVRATGGTTPGYPQFGGTTAGGMYWQTASLGEVDIEAGGTVRVRVDDVPGDQFGITADFDVTTTFNGVTLRVIELGGAISEIQVSPGAFEFSTDVSGNQFKTGPADEAAYPTQDDWLTVNARDDGSNKWNIREGLGPYGPILESFPDSGNDAPTLKTSVIFAQGGTYDVFLNIGDTAAADFDQNLDEQIPLNFGFESGDLTRYHPNDGTFNGTPGYNDYEIHVGKITVEDGEMRDFYIDDVQDGTASRSVYLGMRFALQQNVQISEFPVSPGVNEEDFSDLFGNTFRTWPQDEAAYPTLDDWLTITTREDGSNKWNIRQGLGPYGPILESFPNSGNDAPPLRTSVTFAQGGTYNVILNIGDTAAADEQQNIDDPIPLNFAFEGDELVRYHPNDGTFAGTPGYNDYEIAVGQVTVEAGETRNFIIDDVQDGTASRSVYLGMRFELAEDSGGPSDITNWSLY